MNTQTVSTQFEWHDIQSVTEQESFPREGRCCVVYIKHSALNLNDCDSYRVAPACYERDSGWQLFFDYFEDNDEVISWAYLDDILSDMPNPSNL